MPQTIKWNYSSFTPDLVLSYEWAQESRNVVHALLAGNATAITLRPAAKRRGSLSFFFLTETAARSAGTALALATTFELIDTDHPTQNMYFVIDGTITTQLDPEGKLRWMVNAEYQEA
jgi:hypothetical protein